MAKSKTSKESIMKEAIAEFAHKGPAGARTESIAKSAGCNKALIHYYFATKENLYEQTLRYAIHEFEQYMAQAHASIIDLDSLLDRMTDDFFSYHEQNPNLIRIINWELASGMQVVSTFAAESLRSGETNNLKEVIKLISNLQKQNKIRTDIPALHVFLSITGLLISSLIQSFAAEAVAGFMRMEFLNQRQNTIKQLLKSGLQYGGLQ